MTQNPTITGRLQDIIAARLKTLTDIIRSTCAAVGEKTQAAIIADLEDLLQDTFTGLHATIEDIDAIGQRTTEQEWESAYSRSLEIRTLIQDYEHLNLIRHFVRVGHKLTGTEDLTLYVEENADGALYLAKQRRTSKGQSVSAAALYSFMKAAGKEDGMLLDRANISRHAYYYITTLYTRPDGVFFGNRLTPEELQAITPVGCSPVVAATLLEYNKKELPDIIEALIPPKPKATTGAQVIKTMQNTADMLSRSIMTSDMNEDGQALIARPLLQALKEREEKALKEGEAKGLPVPSATYITQALRGAVVIGELEKPIADGEEKATYKMSLRQLTAHCTGQNNPNNEQVRQIWEACNFLSTQQVEFIEYRSIKSTKRRRGRKPKNSTPDLPAEQQPTGIITAQEEEQKIIYKPYKVRTNPITATFVHPLTEGEDFSGSTEVFLDIHHIITEGRRTDIVEIDGKKAYIKRPVAHLNTLQQMYAFNTAAEIRFYGIMLSKSHILEEDLLQQVFDYDNRLINCTNTQTGKKYRNKGRDRAQLHDMFIKAKETGLIAWYSRRETTDRAGNTAAVWKWGRPEGSTKQLK